MPPGVPLRSRAIEYDVCEWCVLASAGTFLLYVTFVSFNLRENGGEWAFSNEARGRFSWFTLYHLYEVVWWVAVGGRGSRLLVISRSHKERLEGLVIISHKYVLA